MEIFYNDNNLVIKGNNKNSILFNINTDNLTIDGFDISYPWEYEKSWILLEVKEYKNTLFYKFLLDSKHVSIITSDNFEIKEEILSFFWDLDILIIIWTKEAVKIYETIEAKVVIPYWEWKDLFLNTLWQHIEEVSNYKPKSEIIWDVIQYINLSK